MIIHHKNDILRIRSSECKNTRLLKKHPVYNERNVISKAIVKENKNNYAFCVCERLNLNPAYWLSVNWRMIKKSTKNIRMNFRDEM